MIQNETGRQIWRPVSFYSNRVIARNEAISAYAYQLATYRVEIASSFLLAMTRGV